MFNSVWPLCQETWVLLDKVEFFTDPDAIQLPTSPRRKARARPRTTPAAASAGAPASDSIVLQVQGQGSNNVEETTGGLADEIPLSQQSVDSWTESVIMRELDMELQKGRDEREARQKEEEKKRESKIAMGEMAKETVNEEKGVVEDSFA